MYEAPKLTRLGSVAQITASDIKCSSGEDYGYGERWVHPNIPPWTHWSNGNDKQTANELLHGRGCKWVSDL